MSLKVNQKPDIKAYLMNKRLERAGHVWILNSLLMKALVCKLNGKRTRGRLRDHWADRFNNDLIICKQEY